MERIKKIISSLFILFALFYVIFKGIIPGWNNESTDFNNYYVSAQLLVQGESIHQFYDNAWFNQQAIDMGVEKGAKFAPFTPVTAALYVPLTFWDLLTAKRIWLIATLFLLFIIPFRLRHYFNCKLIDSALILALFFVPLASNLNFGQTYLLLAWLLIEAVGLNLSKHKSIAAGIIIGLLASLKFIPILFLAYLRNKKRFSILGLTAAFGAILFISIVFLVADFDLLKSYLSVFSHHIQGDLSGQGKFAIGFQSFDSLLNNLFLVNPDTGVAILTNQPELAAILKIILTITILCFCLIIFIRDRFKFNPINSSIFIFGAFVLLPASASYHFLFLLLPTYFIIDWLKVYKNRIFIIGFVAILMLTFIVQYHHIPEFPNYKVFNILIHYPRFWSLLLLFAYLCYLQLVVFKFDNFNSGDSPPRPKAL